VNIIDAMNDPNLFRRWFEGASWDAWRTVLKASAALPMTEVERTTFRQLAERLPPTSPVREMWIIAGRRCGKDSIASLCAAHAAAFFNPEGKLRPGERAVVLCLACDRDQSRIVQRYINSYFRDIPYLRRMVTRETRDGVELENSVDIVVSTNDYRAVRGRPILCAIMDECAFWNDEHSVAPDVETYAALVPGAVALTGSLLIGISTPYRQAGLLWDKWKASFGKDDADALVILAPSVALNPLLDRRLIDAEMLRDPQRGRSEWLAQWRDDVAAYIARELIEVAVDRGVVSRPPMPLIRYKAFVDPSGGISDSFALAISHQDEGTGGVVLDALIEAVAPFNPAEVTARTASVIRGYGLSECRGDAYSGQWVREAFRACGVTYTPSDLNRSQIYLDALPLFSSGRCRLVDNPVLLEQLVGLERKPTVRGDRIDHRKGDGHHDDCANAVAGSLVLAATTRYDPRPAQFASWGHPVPVRFGPTRLEREAALWSVPSTIPADVPDPEGISRKMLVGRPVVQPPSPFLLGHPVRK
jgi:hypothetical protein